MNIPFKVPFFGKKEPTQAQINREQKQKDSAAHATMNRIASGLEEVRYMNFPISIDPESMVKFEQYCDGLIALASDPRTLSFDTTVIDQHIQDALKYLRNAMENDGSEETILSCYRAITYGLRDARNEMPAAVNKELNLKRREETMERLLKITQFSYEKDLKNKAKLSAERTKLGYEKDVATASARTENLIMQDPLAWKEIDKITLDPDAKLSPQQLEMTAALKDELSKKKSLKNIGLRIGALEKEVVTLETQIRSLLEQLQQTDTVLSEDMLKELGDLQQAYKKAELDRQQQLAALERLADRAQDIAEELYGGAKQKADVIDIKAQYEQQEYEEQRRLKEQAAAAQQMKEEILHRQQMKNEAQQAMNELQDTMQFIRQEEERKENVQEAEEDLLY